MQKSDSHFGLSDGEWERAKAEVRRSIEESAAQRRMTTYSQIAAAVTCVPLDPHSPLMNHLLGAIFRDDHAAGRPTLTALVTHKNGDKEPGSGFYEMARSLGVRFREPYVYWSTQVQDVFKLYAKPNRRRK